MSDLAERVERGAARLDERRPGWWGEVNVEDLDLWDDCQCVIGQLWGEYAAGVDEVLASVEYEDDENYGFIAHTVHQTDALTDLWRGAIERRRARS
jgi:hypothetical protein